MARPKSSVPKKLKLTLTVNAEARELLTALSAAKGKSISSLVEKWAEEEAKRLNISSDSLK